MGLHRRAAGDDEEPGHDGSPRPAGTPGGRALEEWTAAQGQWKAETEIAKARADARRSEATKALRKNPTRLWTWRAFWVWKRKRRPRCAATRWPPPPSKPLAEKLIENPAACWWCGTSLPGWLAGLDREDAAELRAFLMTGWNGKDGWTFDRIARGHRRVPAVCLGVVGGAQPGPWGIPACCHARRRVGRWDAGPLRFAGVARDGRQVEERRPLSGRPRQDAAFGVFADLDGTTRWPGAPSWKARDGPPFLRFDPEALEAFTEWRTGFEADLRTGDLYPALESHLAKYRKLVPALALTFHLADGHAGPVGFASTLRALHWSAYLQTHARRCYGIAHDGEADTARRILERVRKGIWRGMGLEAGTSGGRDGQGWLIRSAWPKRWSFAGGTRAPGGVAGTDTRQGEDAVRGQSEVGAGSEAALRHREILPIRT